MKLESGSAILYVDAVAHFEKALALALR